MGTARLSLRRIARGRELVRGSVAGMLDQRAVGGHGHLATFESGNHVCNNVPYLYRPLTADWLREKLG